MPSSTARGGDGETLLRVSKLSAVEFSEKTDCLLSIINRNWWCIFGPTSIFDQLTSYEKSNVNFFAKSAFFSKLQDRISNTINLSEMKHSPACSTFNSEQNGVLFYASWWNIWRCKASRKKRKPTSPEQVPRGPAGSMAVIDLKNGTEALQTAYGENEPFTRSQVLKKLQKPQFNRYR